MILAGLVPARFRRFWQGQSFIAWRALFCLLLLGADLPDDRAEPNKSPTPSTWQIAFSPNYSSGKYGTDTTTEIIYAPLSIQRLFKDGDVALVVPFLSVTGNGSVTLLSGVPNRRTTAGTGLGPRITEIGLGDMVLRGRYYAIDEKNWWPTIALIARLKIPTAQSQRGLGTGEFDEGLGVETTKSFGEKWLLFADAGFTWIGKPAGFNLRNQWNYDVGIGYNFTKALTMSLYFEEYRAAVEGNQNPQDILISLNYQWTPKLGVIAYSQVGLSDGAPAYAVSLGLSRKF